MLIFFIPRVVPVFADDDHPIYGDSTWLGFVATCVAPQREALCNSVVNGDAMLLSQCVADIISRMLVQIQRYQLGSWGEVPFVEWKALEVPGGRDEKRSGLCSVTQSQRLGAHQHESTWLA